MTIKTLLFGGLLAIAAPAMAHASNDYAREFLTGNCAQSVDPAGCRNAQFMVSILIAGMKKSLSERIDICAHAEVIAIPVLAYDEAQGRCRTVAHVFHVT